MHPRTAKFWKACVAATVLVAAVPASPAAAEPRGPRLERLDRGLVAASTSEGVFLSWRLLATEATGHSATGLTGANFGVYRDGKRIATVTDSTNFLDRDGTATSKYRVGNSRTVSLPICHQSLVCQPSRVYAVIERP